jgi:hypothetical protein
LLAALTAGCVGNIDAADVPGAPSSPEAAATPPTAGPAPSPAPAPARVDPARPFQCPAGARSASTPRVWRLTSEQYAATIRTIPGLDGAQYTNPLQDVELGFRFKSYSDGLRLPDVLVDGLLRVAHDLSAPAVAKLKTASPCTAGDPDAACVRAALAPIGTKAFRRPLRPDELDAIVNLVVGNKAALGVQGALELGVQALLTSPSFLFRSELGTPAHDVAPRARLDPYEVASAISYALTDGPPDAMLMAAAAQGALATPAQIRPHLVRLLPAPGQNRALQRFFREYFRYDHAADVFKDAKAYPQHAPVELIADTDRFVRDVVDQRKDLVATLLSAPWGYAQSKTAPAYGLTATAMMPLTRVQYPAGQRAGLLTQPSFLTAFSQMEENDVIRRGKFIAQSLLCLPLPDTPPENVPPLPPMPNATLRERLAVHRTSVPSCAACHNLMDPLGFGLEGYDHVGRVRTTELGRPVDTIGAINGTGTEIDGPFRGAIELGGKLAGSPAVGRCFVRYSLRYWFGRDEADLDACTLAAAEDALAKSGGDVVELLAALYTSDSFLLRTVP